MSQCAKILEHLESGSPLTPLVAFHLYGTLALHSRVNELREHGHPIICTMIEANGKRVGSYSLEEHYAYG